MFDESFDIIYIFVLFFSLIILLLQQLTSPFG